MIVMHLLNSNSFSGAENVVCQIIEEFKNMNTSMIYVSPTGKIRKTLEEKNIRYFPLSKLSPFEVRKAINIINPDIIHAHDFRASIIAAIAAGKIPVISHLHNNTPWLKQYGINSLVFAAFCFKYKKILSVSDSVMKEYVFGKFLKAKSIVISNPIDVHSIINKVNANEDKKEYDIAFLGRFTLQKNPFTFLEIIRLLKLQKPNLSVIMIGDGELRTQLEVMVQEYELTHNITMVGFCDNPFPLLKKSRILCMPSLWEGFGLAAVEALALGLPVVCSDVGGLPRIVDKSCGKLCRSIEEYITFITELLDNKEMLVEYSNNAIAKAYELDNIKKYIEMLDSIYNSL